MDNITKGDPIKADWANALTNAVNAAAHGKTALRGGGGQNVFISPYQRGSRPLAFDLVEITDDEEGSLSGKISGGVLLSAYKEEQEDKEEQEEKISLKTECMEISDDDGLTWSKPINITEQTKNKDWRILFNGPGNGICMKDGTLVFAAQYWDGKGVPWSTIVYSKDRGKTWHCGTGVNQQTTEAQVIELEDGSIMINARCNWGGSRVVGVTKDLGQTWEKHPTNRTSQLKEPVCQGSLLAVDGVPGAGRVVLFSNPNTTSGRSHMTLKASTNDAGSWPEDKWLLYDARKGWGYSCLAPVDKNHVGVLYESQGALNFLKIPYKDVLNSKNAR